MEKRNLKIYLAPLQGITDYIFRAAYAEVFGGCDKYFSPFIRVQDNTFYRPSQIKDIAPVNNSGLYVIPQFMGNTFEDFSKVDELCTGYGYNEVNLNLGCPYPMVTNRKFGAGLLNDPAAIDTLLHSIFSNSKLQISLKCRIGIHSPDEFRKLIPVLNRYPLSELIIHPRVATQMYKGNVHLQHFYEYSNAIILPVVYNGDIHTLHQLQEINKNTQNLTGIMIGRGILQNLNLVNEIKGENNKDNLIKQKNYHLAFLENCYTKYSGDKAILKRLVEMWNYHCLMHEKSRAVFKAVKKCKTIADYRSVLEELFA